MIIVFYGSSIIKIVLMVMKMIRHTFTIPIQLYAIKSIKSFFVIELLAHASISKLDDSSFEFVVCAILCT